MKISLFHTFAFLPAWFRPSAAEPESGSTSPPPSVPATDPNPAWANAHNVTFPLYMGEPDRSARRGVRGDHPW